MDRMFLEVHLNTVQHFARMFSPRTRKLMEVLALVNAVALLLILLSFHVRFVGQVFGAMDGQILPLHF
jgi:hypothetical protein